LLHKGIVEARDYQARIAESASKANTLVVLPTGLGKTIIALLVASSRLESFPRGKVLILAPTRPLTMQHYNTFRKNLELQPNSFVMLTGMTSPIERATLWRRSQAIFATPQTVLNDVRAGRVSLENVILAVFDEAHRCVRDYSYRELAEKYNSTATAPLLLGLTASPGGSKSKIDEIMRNLSIANVEVRTEEQEDVKPYVEPTEIEIVKVKLPASYEPIVTTLRQIYNEKVSRLRNGGFISRDRVSKKALLESRGLIIRRLQAAGRTGAEKGYIFGAVINQAQAVMVLHALELIETQGISTLLKYLNRLWTKEGAGKSARSLMKDPRWLMVESHANAIAGEEHPKLSELISIVRQQEAKKPESKIIVFTQYRDTIETIMPTLQSLNFKAERFVGQSDRSDNRGMDQAKQWKVLEDFKNGKFSGLVSSSIGEEGLHVPDVDLVVFYEAVPSEIRSIQRKGRTGRTRPGRVVLLLAENTLDEAYYFSSVARERSMLRLVSARQESAKKPTTRKKNPTLLDYLSG
jgi:Fanconi anemia group M protein